MNSGLSESALPFYLFYHLSRSPGDYLGKTVRGRVAFRSREPVNVKITKYINSEKAF